VALQGGFLTNSGAIGGGSGGSGGSGADVGSLVSGGGGNGGTGADLAQGATLTNTGRISGGNGGGAGRGAGGVGNSNAAVGAGGVGLRMTGDGNRLINSGIVGGGRSGDGASLANAVQITGSNNTLELRAGYGFDGKVVAGGGSGSGNTLALGGTTNASFDTSDIGAATSFLYQGFDSYRKIGTSTWTLTGASTAVTPWTLSAGVLSVSANGSLGDVAGTLGFDGGTLQTTANFTLSRAITVDAAGGTIDTVAGTTLAQQGAITGAGGLIKTGAGTLTLSDTVAGTHTYSGGTTLQAGTLMAGMNGAFGTGDLTIQGGALGSTNGAVLGNRLVVQSNFDLLPASSVNDVSFAGLRLNGDILLDTPTGTDVRIRGVVSPLAGQPTSISHVELGGTISGNHGLVLDAVDGNASGGEFVFDMIGSKPNAYTGATTVQGPTLLVLQRTLATGAAAVPGNLNVQGTASVLLSGSEQIADGATVRVDSTGHTTQGFGAFGIPTIALAGLSLYADTETIGRLEGSGSIGLGRGTLSVGEGAFSGSIGDGDLVAAQGGTPSGNLVKHGPGTLTLSGANSYSGSTTVSGGTLSAGAANTFSPRSLHAVQNGGTLDLAGFSQRIAGMTLSAGGTVRLSDATTPGTTLTVTGPWTGQGGTLRLATTLGGSNSVTDRLLLSGPQAIASGSTNVQIVNVNGLGALTTGNGIEVIATEGGGRIDGNAFALAGGHVDAGAYEYRLATTADGGYLRSTAAPPPPASPPPSSPPASPPPPPSPPLPAVVPLYRAEVPLFAALPAQLRQSDLAMLGNLQRRVGELNTNTAGTGDRASRQAWARLVSSDIDIAQQGTVSPVSKGHVNGFQAGTDLLAASNWRAGLYVGQLDGDARVSGFARGVVGQVGSTDLRSQYLGAYATWAPESGFYADIAVQAARHNFSAYPSLNTPAGGKGRSLLASVEVGQSFPLAAGWAIEPQLQLVPPAHGPGRRSRSASATRRARRRPWTPSTCAFASGSYCCLLGPSGCGKTTTLRMIAGHESVSSGDILLENRNITDLPAAERGTAMMFQSFALFPHLSALDNVAFSLKMKGVAKAERHARAQDLLERVAMGHLAQRKPGELSGGQQQRVALARALITAAARAAARRAAVRARPLPAHPDARRAAPLAEGTGPDLHPRHALAGRGDGAGRPHRGDEPGPHRAGRLAARGLQRAGHRIHRPLHGRPQRDRHPPASWRCATTTCASPAAAPAHENGPARHRHRRRIPGHLRAARAEGARRRRRQAVSVMLPEAQFAARRYAPGETRRTCPGHRTPPAACRLISTTQGETHHGRDHDRTIDTPAGLQAPLAAQGHGRHPGHRHRARPSTRRKRSVLRYLGTAVNQDKAIAEKFKADTGIRSSTWPSPPTT
jgi:outer membrane autotransporter protein